MHSAYQKQFDTIKLHLHQLLSDIAHLDEDDLNQPIAPGKWSTGQLMWHIHLSFAGTTGYLKKKIQKPEAIPQQRIIAFIRSFWLKTVLRSKLKFRAPLGLTNFPERIGIYDIENSFRSDLQALEQFLHVFPASVQHKNVFRHPIAGRINMSQTLSFLDEHMLHHGRQIAEFIKNKHH